MKLQSHASDFIKLKRYIYYCKFAIHKYDCFHFRQSILNQFGDKSKYAKNDTMILCYQVTTHVYYGFPYKSVLLILFPSRHHVLEKNWPSLLSSLSLWLSGKGYWFVNHCNFLLIESCGFEPHLKPNWQTVRKLTKITCLVLVLPRKAG